VSRRHAELRRAAEGWTIVDLGSTNGTTVNGKTAKEHRLQNGDRIGFGTSELRFEIKDS
jgi:pSer/pThr/pTyr-binding forkhead associated (FHA) protein